MVENNELNDFAAMMESGKANSDIVAEGSTNENIAVTNATSNPAPVVVADDDEDDVVIAGIDASKVGTTTEHKNSDDYYKAIIEDKLKNVKTADNEFFNEKVAKLAADMENYKKELVQKYGYTPEEAENATKNRAGRLAAEAADAYFEDHPQIAIVRIDKENADKLDFTEEEKAKISAAPTIRLVEVQKEELGTIKVRKKHEKVNLANIIQQHTCNISKYGTPLVNTCDYATFSGASTAQMLNAIYDPDDEKDMYTIISDKLAFVYEKFLGSTTRQKYDIDGKIIMSIEDFANYLAFDDLDTCLHAIYVASSTEMIDSPFECKTDACKRFAREEARRKDPTADVRKIEGRPFNFTYNCKQTISYDGISDGLAADMDYILSNIDKSTTMREYCEEHRGSTRYESTFTKNIYEIEVPSCAKVLNIVSELDEVDEMTAYFAAFAQYLKAIYIPVNDGSGEYYCIKTEKDGPDDEDNGIVKMVEIIRTLNDPDIKILSKRVSECKFNPAFRIKTKCPHCGNESEATFNITSLVFQKALGTEVAIES